MIIVLLHKSAVVTLKATVRSSFLSLIDLTLSGLIYGGWSVPFFHLISEDVIFRT